MTREVHLRGFSQLNEIHQLSSNANFWSENRIGAFHADVFWNSQYPNNLTNQLIGQFHLFKTPFATSIEGKLQNQLNISFAPQWRGLLIASHSEGRSGSSGQYDPLRTTLVTAGITYQDEFEHLQTTFTSQATYQRAQRALTQHLVESTLSGNIRTKGLPVVQISLGNQLNIRHWWEFAPRTLLQNVATATIESNAIPSTSLRSNVTYNLVRELGGVTFTGKERNITFLGDVIYQWTHGINILFMINYTLNWFSSSFTTNAIHRYSAVAQTSEIIKGATIRARATKTHDLLRKARDYNYEASLCYNWRALSLEIRWVSYSLATFRRSDVYVTVTRPFSFDLE